MALTLNPSMHICGNNVLNFQNSLIIVMRIQLWNYLFFYAMNIYDLSLYLIICRVCLLSIMCIQSMMMKPTLTVGQSFPQKKIEESVGY